MRAINGGFSNVEGIPSGRFPIGARITEFFGWDIRYSQERLLTWVNSLLIQEIQSVLFV